MPDLYPEIEPYAQGMLEVTGDDLVYWEVCGNPRGKPAVVLHGGPGSGCTRWHRRIPGVLVNGRFDFQAPLAGAWKLHSLWPRSELVVVNDAGHAASNPGITEELIRATDRLASG